LIAIVFAAQEAAIKAAEEKQKREKMVLEARRQSVLGQKYRDANEPCKSR
jgi:hypothetical protein